MPESELESSPVIALRSALRTIGILLFGLIAFANSHSTHATTIVVLNLDAPGEGLNDVTAVSPIGGNNGLTLGQQRENVFTFAAALLERVIISNLTIEIDANFDTDAELQLEGAPPCTTNGGVIGLAGAATWRVNFTNRPIANTWYPVALANHYANSDLNGSSSSEIEMKFNSSVDSHPSCFQPQDFYYGLDGNPPGNDVDFLTTVLHEMIHGLGFQTLVNLSTGAKASNFNDTYMRNLEDDSLNDNWGDPTMSNAERAASAIDGDDLHWTGANVEANKGSLAGAQDNIPMYAPSPIEGGSSVSHFSRNLTAFELMEPVQENTVETIGLAEFLLQDIGWSTESSQTPIISDINDTTINNAATDNIEFAVMDNDTSANSLIVSASSSNTGIVQNSQLVLSGTGRMRQLTITPETGAVGSTIITVTVDDGANNNSTQFTVNTTSNQPPTVTITSPGDGTVAYSAPQSFSATATDPEQGDISVNISWSSSLAGNLGNGASISPSLIDGTHQITASVTDNDSNNDTDIINITVDLNGDADGDGLSNALEITLGTSPTDSDSDDDLLSDFDEVNMDGDPSNYTPGLDTDPLNPDTDGDGTPDGSDDTPTGAVNVPLAPVTGLAILAFSLFSIGIGAARLWRRRPFVIE